MKIESEKHPSESLLIHENGTSTSSILFTQPSHPSFSFPQYPHMNFDEYDIMSLDNNIFWAMVYGDSGSELDF